MSNDDENDRNPNDPQEQSNIVASFSKYSSSSSSSTSSSSSSSCPSSSSSSSTTPVNSDEATMDEETNAIIEEVYADLIEDVTFGLILQTHRAAKLGYLHLVDPDSDSELDKQYEIYDDADVLGVFKSNTSETSTKSSNSYKNGQNSAALLKYECVCPNCGRNLAAIRFAPHLEKCMGMGRNSSRIATRRIANGGGSGFGAMTDYELDQLIESTGVIPNPRYFEQFNKPAPPAPAPPQQSQPAPQPHSSSESDLISIINAVATDSNIHPSSSCSSLIEIDVSSSSSSSSLQNHPSAHLHHHHHHHHPPSSSSSHNPHPHHHHHLPSTSSSSSITPTTTTSVSSSSSSSFKMPVTKKKKLNNSRSMATSSSSSSSNTRSSAAQSSSTSSSSTSSTTNSSSSSRLNIC